MVDGEQGIIELVYTSQARNAFSHDGLVELLAGSRASNAEAGITGVLLYGDGVFLQVIEGPPDAVRALFERIERDPRHHRIRVVLERPIDERRFGAWSMAFHAPLGWSGPEGFDDLDSLGDRLDGPSGSLVAAFASLHR